MEDHGLIIVWLMRELGQLPGLLAALVGCGVVLTKWKQSGSGSIWALLGFGLAAGTCLLIPLSQILLQRWIIEGYEPAARAGAVATSLGLFWGFLQALVYVFLLVAVFAGRGANQRVSPPPLPR